MAETYPAQAEQGALSLLHFGSGGGVGDRPAHHNLARAVNGFWKICALRPPNHLNASFVEYCLYLFLSPWSLWRGGIDNCRMNFVEMNITLHLLKFRLNITPNLAGVSQSVRANAVR